MFHKLAGKDKFNLREIFSKILYKMAWLSSRTQKHLSFAEAKTTQIFLLQNTIRWYLFSNSYSVDVNKCKTLVNTKWMTYVIKFELMLPIHIYSFNLVVMLLILCTHAKYDTWYIFFLLGSRFVTITFLQPASLKMKRLYYWKTIWN